MVPGRCRYAILLGEDGTIRDDGIVARLSFDRFHVTTTTGGAAAVLHHMEDYLQTEFPELRTWLTSTTEQWAVIAVQGPRSAAVLAPFIPDIDLTAMPHMSVRQGHIGDIPIRLFRVSFTGELGFELNLPPDQAQRVWDSILQGERDAIWHRRHACLAREKGYIVVGQETDGTVIPDDLGLGRTIAQSKADFIGKRSLSRAEMLRPDRKTVGRAAADRSIRGAGGQARRSSPHALHQPARRYRDGGSAEGPSLGHVTSSYHSPVLQRGFALALVSAGRSRVGGRLRIPMGRVAHEVYGHRSDFPRQDRRTPADIPRCQPARRTAVARGGQSAAGCAAGPVSPPGGAGSGNSVCDLRRHRGRNRNWAGSRGIAAYSPVPRSHLTRPSRAMVGTG